MDLREASWDVPPPYLRHPWERARLAFLVRLLARAGLEAGAAHLDIGAGDAWLAAHLGPQLGLGAATCVDPGYRDAAARRRVAAAHPQLTLRSRPPRRRYALVTLLDVLEHVAAPAPLLGRLVAAHLAPGGRVLVTVPAWPALFSAHDHWLGHHRRYTPAALAQLLAGAGLVPCERGGMFGALLVPRALAVVGARLGLPERPGGLRPWRHGRALTGLIDAALAVDGAAMRTASRCGLRPPGLSLWAVCRAAGPPRRPRAPAG